MADPYRSSGAARKGGAADPCRAVAVCGDNRPPPHTLVPSPQGGILRDPRREEEPITVLAGAVTSSYQRTSAPP